MNDKTHNGLHISEVISALSSMVDFSYEMGYHEIGYDPVEEIASVVLCPNCVLFEPHVDLESVEKCKELNLKEIPMNCAKFLSNDGKSGCPILSYKLSDKQ